MSQYDYRDYTTGELRAALEHVDRNDAARLAALEEELRRRETEEEEAFERRARRRRLGVRLAAAPRSVPFALLLHGYFGGALGILGWALLAFGMIFFWVFAAQSEFIPLLQFTGDKETVGGVVQYVDGTNASEDGYEIIKIDYAYIVGKESYVGASYQKAYAPIAQGDAVQVEYLTSAPWRSRIVGAQMAVFGAWAGLAAIIPFVGIVIVAFAFRRGLRYSRLLRNGSLGFGTLVSAEPTGVTINDRPEYRYRYAFQTGDGREYVAEAKSHLRERMEDEEEESLLYNPANPNDAIVLDEMPLKPEIDSNGHFAVSPKSSAKAFLLLILPALTLLGNALVLLAFV